VYCFFLFIIIIIVAVVVIIVIIIIITTTTTTTTNLAVFVADVTSFLLPAGSCRYTIWQVIKNYGDDILTKNKICPPKILGTRSFLFGSRSF
jgi:hypothetical protein